MEVGRQKNSEDLAKTLEKLEEWKKLGKKFRRPGKISRKVGRMEEAL